MTEIGTEPNLRAQLQDQPAIKLCLFVPPYKLQGYVKSSYIIRHNYPLETINTL